MEAAIVIETPERRQRCRSGVFFVNFDQISCITLVFLLLTFKKQKPLKY